MTNSGPNAAIFDGLKAGMTLAKMRAGRAIFMVTRDAPRDAAAGKRPIFPIMYPATMVMYLEGHGEVEEYGRQEGGMRTS